jgi:hypothetical protein
MGFMDKAKKMAEQAQAKLDETQKQFNQKQGGQQGSAGGAPPVQYDSAGRPIPQQAPPAGATPPHGDPLGASPAPPAAAEAQAPPAPPQGEPAGGAPPAPPAPPAPAPQAPATPPGPSAGPEEDRNNPSHEAPKMSSGDPLAG